MKYLEGIDGDETSRADLHFEHTVLRSKSPNLSLRVNIRINNEQEQSLQDGRVVPAASFWKRDAHVEMFYIVAVATAVSHRPLVCEHMYWAVFEVYVRVFAFLPLVSIVRCPQC